MKKSIVAMLSITALAVVANAALPTGTSFEISPYSSGSKFDSQDYKTVFTEGGYCFWDFAGDDFGEFTVTNVTFSGCALYDDTDKGRPEKVETGVTATNNCLSIDTNGGLLKRLIHADGVTTQEVTTAKSFYFDSLVQFTVSEEEDATPADEDKLAIWLKGVDGSTNLMIRAGYFSSTGLVKTNYQITAFEDNTNVQIVPKNWYRLTIEAIKMGTAGAKVLGFRVYIDGQLVKCPGIGDAAGWFVQQRDTLTSTATEYITAGTLFPSMDENSVELEYVGFQGTGALDDFIFTETNPYEVPAFTVAVTVDDTACTGCLEDGIKYVVGSETNDFGSALSTAVPVGTSSVTILAVVPENDGEEPPATLKIADADGFTKGDLDADSGSYYWSKVIDTSALTAGATTNVTITIEKEETVVEESPKIDGADVVTAADFVAGFKAGHTVTLPTGWYWGSGENKGKLFKADNTEYTSIPAYYDVAANGAISLNETVVKPVIGTTKGAGTEPDTEPITVGATTVTLNVTNAKKGLYYGVRKYTALGGQFTDEWQQTAQATDGNFPLPVEKTANATAEFYQVIVTDIAPAGK